MVPSLTEILQTRKRHSVPASFLIPAVARSSDTSNSWMFPFDCPAKEQYTPIRRAGNGCGRISMTQYRRSELHLEWVWFSVVPAHGNTSAGAFLAPKNVGWFHVPKALRPREIPYQVNFKANWICREVVFVKVKTPALPIGFPDESMMTRLSFGDVKLGRLKTLKNSARNCALNASEIFGTGIFLNKEKSISTRPGPITEFRPALPSR